LIQSFYGDRVRRSSMTLVGLVGFSVGVVLLWASPSYPLGLACLLLMGTTYVAVSVSLNTAIQARVAESYRGRVLSIYLMGLMTGVPIGALIEGRVAELAGLRAAVVGAGLVQLAFGAAAVLSGYGFRALDEDVADETPLPVAGTTLARPIAVEEG